MRLIDPPRYGWTRNGEAYHPTIKEVFSECLFRFNIFRSRKNWIPFTILIGNLWFVWVSYQYFTRYFTWDSFFISLILGNTLSTAWEEIFTHRYAHRHFRFTNRFWYKVADHLIIRGLPLETHILPHQVHHLTSDGPYDPYNAKSGMITCFFSDIIHQNIRKDLSYEDFTRAKHFLESLGQRGLCSYEQYLVWGSMEKPWVYLAETLLNFQFWKLIFIILGGLPLAYGMFTMRLLGAIVYRNGNFMIHGYGRGKPKIPREVWDGDNSRNKPIPSLLSNWHNNHHFDPLAANTAFRFPQIDPSYLFLRGLSYLGIVHKFQKRSKEVPS